MYEKVATQLISMGYEVECREITKNGVKKPAYVIGSGSVRPTIYPEDIVLDMISCGDMVSFVSIAEKIARIYEDAKNPAFIDGDIATLDFFKANARVCLMKVTDEDIVKKESPFANVICYIRAITSDYSFKITTAYLESIKISESEAWDIAVKNTSCDVKIQNIGDVLGFGGGFPLWVVRNKFNNYGAGAVLGITKDLVKSVIGSDMDKLVIIPSSVHECLIVEDEGILHTELVEMVKEVNATEVSPVDQLADDVFTLPL